MSKIIQFSKPEDTSVKDALTYALEDHDKLSDVIIIGYEDECLYIRRSNMNRKTALWMIKQAELHTLDLSVNT